LLPKYFIVDNKPINMKVRGRVSEQITNGNKAAAMDVIGFLRSSIGSSTAQFHDSLGIKRACAYSEADFSSQNGDHA
jgi:hypothetical protein